MSELHLSDRDIERLIACEKVFRARPKDPVAVNKSYQQKFSVHSEESGEEFAVFIAYSQIMPQDFSIGLMLEDFLLFRVNGFHGTTRAGYYTAEHHAYPHTHRLTQEDIEKGRRKRPSLVTDVSGEYVDLFTARLYFFTFCGIIGHEQYFDDKRQLSMFDSWR